VSFLLPEAVVKEENLFLSKRVVRAIVLILTDDDDDDEEEEEKEEDNHSDDSDDADAKRRSNSMRARVFVQSATVKLHKNWFV
jgi:hypothetical protein